MQRLLDGLKKRNARLATKLAKLEKEQPAAEPAKPAEKPVDKPIEQPIEVPDPTPQQPTEKPAPPAKPESKPAGWIETIESKILPAKKAEDGAS